MPPGDDRYVLRSPRRRDFLYKATISIYYAIDAALCGKRREEKENSAQVICRFQREDAKIRLNKEVVKRRP